MPDTKDNGATSSLPSELERLAKLFQSSAISKVDFAQFKSKLISSAVAMPPSAILDGLEQLARLHQSGLLTQQEFELAKTRISSASGDNARDVKNEHVKSRNRNRQSYNQTALVLDATKIPSSGWSFITNLGRFLWGRLLGEPVEARLQHPALQNEAIRRFAGIGGLGLVAIVSVWALWSSFGTDAETPEIITASGDTQAVAKLANDMTESRSKSSSDQTPVVVAESLPQSPAGSASAPAAVRECMATARPSFDCSNASTLVEQSICEIRDIALADCLLGKLYKDAHVIAQRNGTIKALVKRQRNWLRERDELCVQQPSTIQSCIIAQSEARSWQIIEEFALDASRYGIASQATQMSATTDTDPFKLPQSVRDYEISDERCRGGSGNDPATWSACEARDALYPKLIESGWCKGQANQSGAEMVWHRCNERSCGIGENCK